MSSTDYKRLMKEARELRGSSNAMTYQRAKLLVAIYEDADFRGDPLYQKEEDAVAALDDLADGLFCGFLRLREMITRFPKREIWEKEKLTRLEAEIVAEKNKRRREEKKAGKRHVVTQQEHKKLEDECKAAKGIAANLENQKAELVQESISWKQERSVLLKQISLLEKELDEANSKIREMESQLSRDAVAV